LSSRNVFCPLQSVQVRFKGHSKWQNIKHIKAANDLRIGRMCNKYAHLIGSAIRENGMEKNPEYNCKNLILLKDLFREQQKHYLCFLVFVSDLVEQI